MKISKNKTKIVSLRVNEEDYKKIVEFAKISGLKTPSALMRMYFNAIVVQFDKLQEKQNNIEVIRNENSKTNKHD